MEKMIKKAYESVKIKLFEKIIISKIICHKISFFFFFVTIFFVILSYITNSQYSKLGV